MSDLISRVAGRDEQAVAGLVATLPAEEVVELLAATSDDDVRRLTEDAAVRRGAVTALLGRLHEFADPVRLAEIEGVVDFDLRLRTGSECYRLRFADGAIDTDVELDGPADVVVRLSALRFLRLVTGQANAGLLLLGGRLSVEGDAMLALAVGGVFRVPGTDAPAVDPAALDPVDVARAIAKVRTEHLRDVMAGGFRPVVLGEIFRRMPEYVDPAKAAGLRCTVAFRVGGRPDGGHDRYLVQVADGVCEVVEDTGEGIPRDVTLSLSGVDFLRLATGHLNPVLGVLKGSLKVKGDRTKALAFSSSLDLPVAS
ncbi:SCP2 sterol-binding domain-containing protein [Nocardioides massiliensis]|uniref:Sterol carrier protein n=1 Tax=Nocardioides massiliensis TaxID=1325935 RepID=A0ABT9NSD2_9ACTN|nr:SCP2 sterol-binding domain-containing protein [Nocardioides massiliensis]MDP9823216.1 putative sterol carrier protein [Nocardioides massiliensis]